MQSQSSALSYLYAQASCAICLELAFRPHVLSPCGHTFCARCLIDWFQRPAQGEVVHIPAYFTESQRRDEEIAATRRRKKVCPHCRGEVRGHPAEVWSIKGMIDRLDLSHRAGHFLVEGGATNPQTAQEERYSRGVDLGTGPAIWQDIFDDRSRLGAIYDEAEGIYRCSQCTGEIVGIECCSCGAIYSDLEPDDFEDGSGDGESDDTHADGLRELYEPTLAAAMGLYDPHSVRADSSDHPYEDGDESSIGSFIVDDNAAVESASSSGDDDDGDDVNRLIREAERLARSASRRYGYSSEEGGGESDADDSSDSSFRADDDAVAASLSHEGARGGQPSRGGGASAHATRGRQRATVVPDSEEDDDEVVPESTRSAASTRPQVPRLSRQQVPLSSDDEDEDEDSYVSESDSGSDDGSNISVSNDVEDAADADRWLSYAGVDDSDDNDDSGSDEDSDDYSD